MFSRKFERLEERRLLAAVPSIQVVNKVAYVNTTEGNDQVTVIQNDRVVITSVEYETDDGNTETIAESYPFDQIELFVIRTGDGSDFVDVSDSGKPSEIYLGPGRIDVAYGSTDAFNFIAGGPGIDVITGGDEGNEIRGGKGGDHLTGGEFIDTIYGHNGPDVIIGLGHGDLIYGGNGKNILLGGDGNDSIFGGPKRDAIDGGDGDDTIRSFQGNDVVLGGDGNDWIHTGRGADIIDAGTGIDYVFAGRGKDKISGGDDSDPDVLDLGRDRVRDDVQIGVNDSTDNFRTFNKRKNRHRSDVVVSSVQVPTAPFDYDDPFDDEEFLSYAGLHLRI